MVCTSSFHYHTPWKFFFTPSLHFLENLACHQVNVGLFISQQPSGPASDLIPLSFPNHLLLMSTHCYFNPGCNDITDFWNPCQLFVNNFACSLAPFPIFSSLNRAFYFFFFLNLPLLLGIFSTLMASPLALCGSPHYYVAISELETKFTQASSWCWIFLIWSVGSLIKFNTS